MAYSKFDCRIIGVGRSTITEHINNILNSGELDENNTVGKTDVYSSLRSKNDRKWKTKILSKGDDKCGKGFNY